MHFWWPMMTILYIFTSSKGVSKFPNLCTARMRCTVHPNRDSSQKKLSTLGD